MIPPQRLLQLQNRFLSTPSRRTSTPLVLLLLPYRPGSSPARPQLHRWQPQKQTMAVHLQGRCVCNRVRYALELPSGGEARTTLCHCHSCRRAFGANYGLTAKVPVAAFRYEPGSARPRRHTQANGVTREFCDACGAFLCEYGVRRASIVIAGACVLAYPPTYLPA